MMRAMAATAPRRDAALRFVEDFALLLTEVGVPRMPARVFACVLADDSGGLTAAELAERVGFGRRHMSLLLLRLEEHGAVVHEGRRWFPGPETGELIRG